MTKDTHIYVSTSGSILIDGISWYTRNQYLANAGFSVKSTQIPYLHERNNLAETLNVLSTTLFRPLNGFESVKNRNK